MAHCVHCGAGGETEVLHRTKCGVVHCASSNFMLKSGVLDVRPMLAKGVKVTLRSVADHPSASLELRLDRLTKAF